MTSGHPSYKSNVSPPSGIRVVFFTFFVLFYRMIIDLSSILFCVQKASKNVRWKAKYGLRATEQSVELHLLRVSENPIPHLDAELWVMASLEAFNFKHVSLSHQRLFRCIGSFLAAP